MTLEFHPQVAEDFLEAAEFCESRNPNLALAFQREFNQVVEQIITNPLLYAEVKGIRRALLAHFPFSVLYRVRDPDIIRVLALRHHKRKVRLVGGRE